MALYQTNKVFQHNPQAGHSGVMQRFGIPEIFALQWIEFLDTMKRVLHFKGALSKPHASVCGVPEGDPLSVVLSVLVS